MGDSCITACGSGTCSVAGLQGINTDQLIIDLAANFSYTCDTIDQTGFRFSPGIVGSTNHCVPAGNGATPTCSNIHNSVNRYCACEPASTATPTATHTASPTAIPTASPTAIPTASPTSMPSTSPVGASGGLQGDEIAILVVNLVLVVSLILVVIYKRSFAEAVKEGVEINGV